MCFKKEKENNRGCVRKKADMILTTDFHRRTRILGYLQAQPAAECRPKRRLLLLNGLFLRKKRQGQHPGDELVRAGFVAANTDLHSLIAVGRFGGVGAEETVPPCEGEAVVGVALCFADGVMDAVHPVNPRQQGHGMQQTVLPVDEQVEQQDGQ